MTRRAGAVSLAELVLVAWLFALVIGGVARFAAGQNQIAALQRDRLRLEEAVRTIAVVLGTELRHLVHEDVAATAADSIRTRAFRGGGPVCSASDEEVRVSYRGVRQPDPARDSVLLLAPTTATAHRLRSAGPSSTCPDGVHVRLDPPAPADAGYALFFETGAYSVSDGALRYRRGLGGRQPLTESVLRDMAIEGATGGFALRLVPDTDSLSRLRSEPRWLGIATLNGRGAPGAPSP
jgi:hypothetical protein